MSWKDKVIDLGIVKEDSTTNFKFNFTGDIKLIKDFRVGCSGCTKISPIKPNGDLEVKFSASKVPLHLNKKEIEFSKVIYVKYVHTNKEDILTFKGKIKK